ncbi:E3 ubiquitin-protein ligase CG7694, partial [Trifolium medium]|nr:E3 ubiquitin-protein ligase CG7694 [Trifolium medium]
DDDEEEEDEDDEDEGERELPEVEAATEPEGIFSQIIRETWLALDDADLPHGANFGDFLDTRRFDDLLDHLAENDSSRRGAPPAAASFVNSLPCVVISKEHEKHDELVCAICKDVLALGTKVNQLPCSHLYHSHCILPWLKTRNSCPLCRFELPTDDKDYEEGKQTTDGRNVIYERHQLNVGDDSFSDISDGAEAGEEDGITTHDTADSSAIRSGRGRWLFLAAAPIVSLVGMVIVLWLGRNSQIEGTR